jgi:enoyl-[acyl-carrier-protein] reductase (NADH)
MNLLSGKVAIVTGAARGIGEAVALKFAQEGAHVAFTYVSDSSRDKANALVEKITALGVKAKAYQSNAADFNACETFTRAAFVRGTLMAVAVIADHSLGWRSKSTSGFRLSQRRPPVRAFLPFSVAYAFCVVAHSRTYCLLQLALVRCYLVACSYRLTMVLRFVVVALSAPLRCRKA